MRFSTNARQVLAEIGARIRRARLAAGRTQEDAASRSGIDYKRWQRIEAGGVNLTIRTLVRIADAVDTTVWGVLEVTATPKGPTTPSTKRARRSS